MEPPSLRLVILQGPREGETLDFRPGSAIRIGRVIRGNTLPIKDSGISSKHLSILTESGKWVLRDLDSSNGTVLDGTKVAPPHTPVDVNDGSTIKIGELTSILVTFLHPPTLSGPTGAEPDPETEEGAPAAAAKPGRPARTRVTRNSKNEVRVSDSSVVVGNLGAAEAVNTRVTRNSKNKRNVIEEISDLGDLEERVGEPKITRVTRNTKSKRNVIEISDSVAPEEKVEEPKNTRVTRNSKNKRNVIGISDSRIGNLEALEEKVEEPKIRRVTRNSKNKRNEIETSDSRIGNLDAVEEKVEGPKIKRVTRSVKNKRSEVEPSDSRIGNLDAVEEKVEEPENKWVTGNSNNEESVIEESPQNSSLEPRVENVEKKKTRGGAKSGELQEECNGKENGDGTEKEKLNGDENLPDLEKLSLGEWFDFLEVHLPKQIIDATEEMFDSMRQKAERLREYIMMQKNHQVEVPAV
ncbi:FHA domain-containing protein At4g14490-like [Lotus japonicus]|uniref:FHA domain-containing protein At4g14490-like n=1 Tax=Lotus japonicus TaxID=34305 RepID=UPI002588DDB5|nr:FHA domain-containing protein At4g14490-like [Lotus japonicus]